MNRMYFMAAVASGLLGAACAVSTDGWCDTEADCAPGAECVDNLCSGGAQPSAKVTAPNEVALDEIVTLDASTSARDDGSTDGLAYEWTILSPEGASFEGAADQPVVKLKASVAHGAYKVQLVTKDRGTASAPVTHEFKVKNSLPVAYLNASPQTWTRMTEVTFDASESTDPDGDPLTYEWTLLAPAGQEGALTPGQGGTATLMTGATAAKYTVRVVVSDGRGGTATETVSQTLENAPPTVHPGTPQTVDHECTASQCFANADLVGTVTDADGTIVEPVKWTFKSGPTGAVPQVTLQPVARNGNEYQTTATISVNSPSTPIVGDYVFELEATDNDGDSTKKHVTVTVGNRAPTISFTSTQDPLQATYSMVDGKFHVVLTPSVEVADEDGDVLTVEFLGIETSLPGVTVEDPVVTGNSALYRIVVEPGHPQSLFNGMTPLYELKARVSDVNGGADEATLPVLITGNVAVEGTFFDAPVTTPGHVYGTLPGYGTGYYQEYPVEDLSIAHPNDVELEVGWTHSGGPGDTQLIRTGGGVVPEKLTLFSTNKSLVNAAVTVTMTVQDPFGAPVTKSKTFTMRNRPPVIVENSFKLLGEPVGTSVIDRYTCGGQENNVCYKYASPLPGQPLQCVMQQMHDVNGGTYWVRSEVDVVWGGNLSASVAKSTEPTATLQREIRVYDPDGDPVSVNFGISGSVNRFKLDSGWSDTETVTCQTSDSTNDLVCTATSKYGFVPENGPSPVYVYNVRDTVDTIRATPHDGFENGVAAQGRISRKFGPPPGGLCLSVQ